VIHFTAKDFDGKVYEFTSRNSRPRNASAKPYQNEPHALIRLIARLPVADNTWRRLLHNADMRPPHANALHKAVVAGLMQGKFKLYQYTPLETRPSLKGKHNTSLNVVKGPNPHPATTLQPEIISDRTSLQKILDDLGIDQNTFLQYLTTEKLLDGNNKQDPMDEVVNLVTQGNLFLYKIPRLGNAPEPKKVEYENTSRAMFQPVPLAPESSSRAPATAPAPETVATSATPNADAPGTNPAGETCPETSKTCTGGEPISLVTGEELLELQDFSIDGLINQPWTRTYRSSNRKNIGLGTGWSHPFGETLEATSTQVFLNDAEGRRIGFVVPEIGESTENRSEQLRLSRIDQHRYRLTPSVPSTGHIREFAQITSSNVLNLVALIDNIGNRLTLNYESAHLTHIDAQHQRWNLAYHANGNISAISVINQEGQIRQLVAYDYDEAGDLIQATDATGRQEKYAFQNHLISKRTLKTGYSFYFNWDGTGPDARCIRNWGDSIDDQPTYDYHFAWDKANRRVNMTDTRGGKQTYQFNGHGLPIYHRDAEGGETHTQYDNFGNITQTKDAIGAITRYHYDDQQRLTSVTNKTGQTTQLIRDHRGNIIELRDPSNHGWKRKFNALGLISNQTNPRGETTHYQYNNLGLVNALTDPLDRVWHFIWDNRGKLIARKDPKGNQTRYSYNDWGDLLKITWPDQQVSEYRYDNQGKCIAIKHPDGKTEQFTYNELGLLKSQQDSTGRTTQYKYNGLSQVVRRINPDGSNLHYHYDGERNLIGLTNENGEHYQLDYDLNERLTQEVGFDGRIQRYQYNAAGHLQSAQDFSRDGHTLVNRIDFSRRADGRLLKQTDAINNVTLSEFDYDAVGRLTLAKNPSRELRWAYDPVGSVVEDWQDQHLIRHNYNAVGERIQTQLPDGQKISYSYNTNGQFTGLAFNQKTVVALAHDAMGRELKRLHGNQLETESRYDPQGRLIAQRTGKRAQDNNFAPISQRRFHYNAFGQLAQIDDLLRGSTRYHYDALDRLTQVEGPNPETFVHDPAGNILRSNTESGTNSPTYNSGNRLALYGDNHYSYDERGNRTLAARGKQQAIKQHLHYNALNQLTSVDVQNRTTRYQYDALGRRISKRSAVNSTEFLWLDNTLLSETTTDIGEQPQTAKIYLFEPGTHKPLAVAQNDEIFHYHLDHLGTPQEITNAQGKIAWSASYKAYGNLALVQDNEIENNIRFQGQYYDEETGLHYNRFRYYDPACGRFISQDPIGLLGGVNNYQYAPNPVSWVDPFGLSCKETKYTNVKEMDPDYGGEELGFAKAWIEAVPFAVEVEYLMSDAERAQYEVTVKNGLLHDAKGNLLDTADSNEGKYIFVMDPQGKIFAGSPRIFEFHHSSFFAGAPVAAAGEIEVANGMLLMNDNNSGHYKPANEHNDQFIQELADRGIDGSKTRKSVKRD
jgi:RHS repeat-associated protein